MSPSPWERALPPAPAGEPVPENNGLTSSSAPLGLCPPLRSLATLDARFADFIDYAEAVRGVSRCTVKNYVAAYRMFRRFLADPLTVPGAPLDTKGRAIAAWMRWLFDRPGCGPQTRHTYFRNLGAFFRDLERRDGIPTPFAGMKAPPLPTCLPKARTFAECQRILLAAEHYPWRSDFERARALAFFALLIYAGLRRGEALALGAADVDLREGSLRVRHGKGRGGGKERVVALAPELKEILRMYLRTRTACGFVTPEFFCATDGSRGLPLMTLRRMLAAIQRASGVPFTLHSLRHSFITHLLRAGAPIHTVAALAGHADISTTAGYTAVWEADKQKAVRKLSFQ